MEELKTSESEHNDDEDDWGLDNDEVEDILLEHQLKKRRLMSDLFFTENLFVVLGNLNSDDTIIVPRGPDNFIECERDEAMLETFQNLANMDYSLFRRKFRLTKEEASDLCDKLDFNRVHNRGRKHYPPIIQLCLTLRYLAGASYLDLIALFTRDIVSSLYFILHRVVALINRALEISFPETNDEAIQIERKFRLPGCIGAVDGLLVPITCPKNENPVVYYTRKCVYALNVQAVADSQAKFIYLSVKWTGPTPDSTAFRSTTLFRSAEENQVVALTNKRYIVGDAAYPLTVWLLKPFQKGCPRYSDNDNYNFMLSSCRVCIERAFGILTQRWRALNFANQCSIEHIKAFIQCCVRLHNICIDRIVKDGYFEDPDDDSGHRGRRIIPLDDARATMYRRVPIGELPDHGAHYNAAEQRRAELRQYIKDRHITRPVIG